MLPNTNNGHYLFGMGTSEGVLAGMGSFSGTISGFEGAGCLSGCVGAISGVCGTAGISGWFVSYFIFGSFMQRFVAQRKQILTSICFSIDRGHYIT
jgi:hypothetical protein